MWVTHVVAASRRLHVRAAILRFIAAVYGLDNKPAQLRTRHRLSDHCTLKWLWGSCPNARNVESQRESVRWAASGWF